MQRLPSVGLVLIRKGLAGCEAEREVHQVIQTDTENVTSHLSRIFELRGTWVVDSSAALEACARAIAGLDVDMVLFAYQTWGEDRLLVDLLRAIGNRPLVLWCYLPWRRLPRPGSFAEVLRGSGPVGAFPALGTLRNMNAPFLFTYGAVDDPRLVRDLEVAGQAAQARQTLREAVFGVLPSTSDVMLCTHVDAECLREELGPRVALLPVAALQQALSATPEEQRAAYLQHLRARYAVPGVEAGALERAAGLALGLGRLAVEQGLTLLAVNELDPTLVEAGIRPSLYPELPEPQAGVLFQSEPDLGAAAANLVLHRLTGSPTLLLEIWFWDEAKNLVVGGHAGLQNPALAGPGPVEICPDPDPCQPGGVQMQMVARPGRVTLFQLRRGPERWHAIATTGVCLESQPWAGAYPHAVVRLDAPIDQFLDHVAEAGASHHWIMAYGSVIREIEAFCQMAPVALRVI